MCITRRHILALTGSSLLSRILNASVPATSQPVRFDVDRLLEAHYPGRDSTVCRTEFRKYVASATVTLFSIPLVSRNCVGSGYAVVEEADTGTGRAISIQFGAGSYPESARELNRLGFIQEAIVEEQPGQTAECAWLAFMTTSKESSLDQAKKALEAGGAMVPYSASQGHGQHGRFVSRVDRIEFPSRYTWRDITSLVEQARGAMSAGSSGEQPPLAPAAERPATFLYQVRRAMLDERSRATSVVVFNGKEFQLDTQKEKDAAATAHFRERGLLTADRCAMRMDSLLIEKRTGIRTPFRLWYESGGEHIPPLRFEYQAKSFLRLTFEAGTAVDAPPVRFAFKPAVGAEQGGTF